MKVATVNEIKQELSHQPASELAALCLRLVKFKKENKELLSFLLFEATNLEGYIESLKKEMDDLFEEMNTSNLYFAKKTLRKILRLVTRHSKFTLSKGAEIEWLIHFCKKVKKSGLPINKSPALSNLYINQVKKIYKNIETLHEDLQFDYIKQVEPLE